MWQSWLIVALRALARHRLFSALNIGRLAVGMAACAAPSHQRSVKQARTSAATAAAMARSAAGVSCTSVTRISMALRSKRAMAPRELSHS